MACRVLPGVREQRRSLTVTDRNIPDGFISMFDGKTLDGWRQIPRIYGDIAPGGRSVVEVLAEQGIPMPPNPELHPAVWTVEGGEIVGRQDSPGSGYGGYLISDQRFRDFELVISAKPDWPADTGIMLRRQRDSWEGVQLLLDHRPKGGMGGFFGNGLASFSAAPFTVDAVRDDQGIANGLTIHDPGVGPETTIGDRRGQLTYAVDAEEFRQVWRWADWNDIRVRCVGDLPVLTTWINDLKVAELDMATIRWPGYDAAAARDLLGDGGHIALEVHDNDPTQGTERWGVGAECRWRDIAIREI